MQHIIWTLQLLEIVHYETEEEIVWTLVSRYCSTRNTLKLFKRFLRSFTKQAKRKERLDFSNSTDGKHVYIDPFVELKVDDTNRNAGEFMCRTFLIYRKIITNLEGWTFEVKVDDKHYHYSYTASEIQQLQTWLCFATNACMHEKVWQNFFAVFP